MITDKRRGKKKRMDSIHLWMSTDTYKNITYYVIGEENPKP
jgi:hypothetical protein